MLIRSGEGKEGPKEFQQFSDTMWEDLAPAGAAEELLVEELIGISWRKRRVLAYESAVIGKQQDKAIGDWEQQHPVVQAHKQWADQPDNSLWKLVSGLSVKPIDAYILWYVMQALPLKELAEEEPLSSPRVRGITCLVAQKFGVDVDDAMGSKPESQLYVDCSSEQIQKVIDAACELKNISQDDFWNAVDDHTLRARQEAAEQLAQIDFERQPGGRNGWPADGSLAKIHGTRHRWQWMSILLGSLVGRRSHFDEGLLDPQIAGALVVAKAATWRTRKRFVNAGLKSALQKKPRPRQSRKLGDKDGSHLIAVARRKPPEGHMRWSSRLLAGRVREVGRMRPFVRHSRE